MEYIKKIDAFINEMSEHNVRIFNNMPSDELDKFRPVQLGIDGIRKIIESPEIKKILEKYNCVVDYSSSIKIVLLFDDKENNNKKVYTSFQNMLHELDLKTELYIGTEVSDDAMFNGKKIYWYGRHNYKDMDYYINHSYEWLPYKSLKNIINDFANIHGKENTNCLYHNWAEKTLNKKGYAFTDTDILNYAKSYIEKHYPKFEIEILHGKRSYDTTCYNAFVISRKGYKNAFGGQAGSFVIELMENGTSDEINNYRIRVSAPLGGEYKSKINIANWKETIDKAIDYLCN